MVAIPLAHDQPAIAARLGRAGAAIVIPPSRLSVAKLHSALRDLLSNDNGYRARARQLQQAAQSAGGITAAVNLLEEAAGASSSVIGNAQPLGAKQ